MTKQFSSHSAAMQFQLHHSIDDLNKQQWQQLSHCAGPFLQYTWLQLLEHTHCVGEGTGWQPAHWTATIDGELIAAVPGYIKTHSYGEYVFDHSWANAYHQHGIDYYPKWIAAIPFTPVTGPRLLARPETEEQHLTALINHIDNWAVNNAHSSCHWLFNVPSQQANFEQRGFANRFSVQFEWNNRGYDNFEDFLTRLTSRKRRSIRKTRKQFDNPAINIERLSGDNLSKADMAFFVHCYQDTYLKRSGHKGYLTPAFFTALFDQFREHILLVKAQLNDTDIAAALFLFDNHGLYGRYWGCLEDINELHFECCYFQGIEFAIERNIARFNPGTQGEHKLLRGFEPIYCVSHHKMHDPRFHAAVSDFLQREKPIITDYFNQALDVLPFNEAYLQEFIPTTQKGTQSTN
ncbi:GNAT family N-acetyltransferase [Alteromonas gilva]|uniref:GNAT family N-acetyltransferase n=1 Tax=Alteromonas gilva TaxID=2987522 RepID=A0ABT5L3U2_9ALTE|nr:peptidogalycan biosysnthesis protein [Alteromonas gilva]MDC8830527.1 GNAT family N-acetyltransferase [Alteromonas gilva]